MQSLLGGRWQGCRECALLLGTCQDCNSVSVYSENFYIPDAYMPGRSSGPVLSVFGGQEREISRR